MNTIRTSETRRPALIRSILLSCPLFSVLLLASPVRADDVIDSPMYRDPVLPKSPESNVFPEGLLPLWLQALDRPEADMKRQAALTITEAHGRGMTGLTPAIPALTRELAHTNPGVRAAAAQALVALDAKDAAAKLLAAGLDDNDTREVVEPALAKWAFAPARDEWLRRISSPPPHRRPVVLAVQCLAVMTDEKAAPRLRELALAEDTPPVVRLEAARALGACRRTGGEADSDTLSKGDTLSRVAAASVLRHHDGAGAIRRLQKFAVDAEPTVAAVALARLVEIDPKLVVPSLPTVLASKDANVRSFGVDVLFREASEPHIRLLGERLGDLHPDVRIKARKFLRELAGKENFKAWVLTAGETALATKAWRAKEQAALLLGQLDHKPAAGRLAALLDDDRPEVAVASAWSLRVLAVPDTLPKVLAYVKANTAPGDVFTRRKIGGALDDQLSQLCQFLGKVRHLPADATLRAMVPARPERMSESRAAACWALGLFHEGKTVAPLATAFAGRVAAVKPFDIEDDRVRRMCAIGLGRMKAQAALPTLKEFCPGMEFSTHDVNNACGWAIEQVTGTKLPPPKPVKYSQRLWFLVPLDK
jgi:HEAT repeat protein